MVGSAMLIYGVMWWVLDRENRARRDKRFDHRFQNMTEEELAELGDESPKFYYTT